MENLNNSYSMIVNHIFEGDLTQQDKVTILKLISNELQVCTISEMARRDNKTPAGVRKSKKYEKVEIGNQLMTYKNLPNN